MATTKLTSPTSLRGTNSIMDAYVWLPTFNKLALRNDDDTLKTGTYEVSIGLHFPQSYLTMVRNLSTYPRDPSWVGKNDFLGISWMVGGALALCGLDWLVVNTIKPRRNGDVNLLSWNREQFAEMKRRSSLTNVEKD